MEEILITPWLVFAAVALIVMLLLGSLLRDDGEQRPAPRRQVPDDDRRCLGCGQGHPPWAKYCRRCGRRLWQWH